MTDRTCEPPDDYDEDHDEEVDEWFDRCARLRDGTCMLAGTEECDFECPFRDR